MVSDFKEKMIEVPEQKNLNNSIFLDDGMFRDPSCLQVFLGDLYIGPTACYNLNFKRHHVKAINKIFDKIIMRYGHTSVSFKYRLL